MDTQFGVCRSGTCRNMDGKRKQRRSWKQSHNKENNCVQETNKPKVVSGCIGCRKQRLENDGRVKKFWKKFNMALTLLNIIKEVTKPKPAPGVLDASLARDLKSTRPLSKRGSSDNDQHSLVKRRKSNSSSACKSGLKYITESIHLEGSSDNNQHSPLKRRKSDSSNARKRGLKHTTESIHLEGSSDNDQHSPLKRRKSNSSNARKRGLKDITESIHLEGTGNYVKRRRSPSCSSKRRLEFRNDNLPGETCKPEVASGCSDCIKQRLEIEGLKTKIKKLERRLHFVWTLSTIIKEARKTRPAVCVASLVSEFKMMEPVEDSVSGSVNTANDILIGKEKFSSSIGLDNENESKTGDSHQPVNPGTSDKDQCSTVERKGESMLHWDRGASDGIGVMSEKSKVETKKGKPDDEVLEELGGKIPKEWKRLGRRLKVGHTNLVTIDEEEDQLHEKAYTMLLKWKQAKGEEATFLVLYKALCDPLVLRRDLAEEYCCVCHS